MFSGGSVGKINYEKCSCNLARSHCFKRSTLTIRCPWYYVKSIRLLLKWISYEGPINSVLVRV